MWTNSPCVGGENPHPEAGRGLRPQRPSPPTTSRLIYSPAGCWGATVGTQADHLLNALGKRRRSAGAEMGAKCAEICPPGEGVGRESPRGHPFPPLSSPPPSNQRLVLWDPRVPPAARGNCRASPLPGAPHPGATVSPTLRMPENSKVLSLPHVPPPVGTSERLIEGPYFCIRGSRNSERCGRLPEDTQLGRD